MKGDSLYALLCAATFIALCIHPVSTPKQFWTTSDRDAEVKVTHPLLGLLPLSTP
jgi:hypothetical protein